MNVMASMGWDAGWADAFDPFVSTGSRPARVVAVHKETAIVRQADALYASSDRPALVSGRFRFDALAPSDYPAVGDWVAVAPQTTSTTGGPAIITAVLPRRSAFVRSAADASRRTAGHLVDEQVLAANVDVAFLVAGLDHDFNVRRLERYLAVAWSSGVRPVVVLNKADVAIDLDQRLLVEPVAPAVPIVVLSALTGDHVTDLSAYLEPGKTAVVLGSSGVGKSTLVNTLLGEARQVTVAVRGDDSRGRHTTTHRELFELPGGALLIDTPGIRALEVAGADEGVDTAFDDIADFASACRFSDCRHEGEPGCAVRAALDDGRAEPRPAREPSQARARAGTCRAQGRCARPSGGDEALEVDPQGGGSTGAREVRRHAPMTTSTDTWLEIADAPRIQGLRF